MFTAHSLTKISLDLVQSLPYDRVKPLVGFIVSIYKSSQRIQVIQTEISAPCFFFAEYLLHVLLPRSNFCNMNK